MHPELWKAATFGNADVVARNQTLLLEVTIDGNSALHIAAKHGRERIAMQVSEAQPCLLRLPNKSGDTPLHLASAAGHLRIVNFFINQHRRLRQHHRESSGGVDQEEGGEDENDVEWMTTAAIANKIGNTALHEATIGGHLDVVKRLLETAPQLTTMTNRAGVSALYIAAERKLLDIVERILRVPLAVSHEGLRGQTALHAAVLRSEEISRMILDKNPSCLKHQDASKSTPLHFAAASGDAKILRLLIEKDPSAVYMKDGEGFAIIHIAASAGNLDKIKVILEYCPDALEQKNNEGRNFVHVAVEQKNLKVVKCVLNSRDLLPLLNEQDHEGNTPLHLAVLARGPEMIQMLLSSGIVDTALTNNSGFTPIDLASSKFSIEVGLRMYSIMTDLISYGSRFSPQRDDHLRNQWQRKQDKKINGYQELADILAIIAVLIATVTFAAAFTLPGGYKNNSESDDGMAILSSKASFKAFLISDTVAMVSSITVVLVLQLYSGSQDHDVRLHSLKIAMELLRLALTGMSVAFITGVYTVIERRSKWVVVLVALIACIVPLIAQLVADGHSADYLSINFDPEELTRQAKRKSKVYDFLVRIIQNYLSLLGLPPTAATVTLNHLVRLVEEPPLTKKWSRLNHH